MSCQLLGTSIVIKKLSSEEMFINHIFAIIFNAVLIVPTISLNAIAAATIFKATHLRRKSCYFTILVQSHVDLAIGVFALPLLLYLQISQTGNVSC